MHAESIYDVVIIGGSYAGLSAAMALGRAIRRVLIIDSGKPCNQQTPHSHNLITQDGATPAHITTVAREQVLAYPTVSFQMGTVATVTGVSGAFEVEVQSGETVRARKILFATGLQDLLPSIPGLAACWGISVIHCPYCHGYEYRNQPTGILVNGTESLHFGKLIRNWTNELTIFTNGAPTFDEDILHQLQSIPIPVVTKPVQEIVHTQGIISSLLFSDGSLHSLQALYARVPFTQHSPLLQALGCTFTKTGLVQVDDFRRTSVPGLYAAGDNSSPMRSVAGAIAAGTAAGAFINHDLISEEF